MEEWKDIKGYEGLYKMSTKLRIYDIINDCFKEPDERFGYLYIRLTKDGKRTTHKFSRLLGLAFIPIPEELANVPLSKLDVHHIDFDRMNNDLSNLMWVTHAKHMEIHKARKVYQYGLDGAFIKEWISFSEIGRQLGFIPQNIRKCCVGDIETAYKYQWRYEKYESIPPSRTKKELMSESIGRTVGQYSLDGKLIKVCQSCMEMERQLGFCHSSISRCCRTGKPYKGFFWKYV